MNTYQEEHKILYKKIYNCNCMPLAGKPYCENCQKAIIEFMNQYGAGVLTNDILIEQLQKENKELKNKNNSLENNLKIMREKYEMFKLQEKK